MNIRRKLTKAFQAQRWHRWQAELQSLGLSAPAPVDPPRISIISPEHKANASKAPVLPFSDPVQIRDGWVGLLHPGDTLSPHALKLIQISLRAAPHAQLLYTDEMIAPEGLQLDPWPEVRVFLKPGFDPVLLEGIDYISRFVLFRYERLVELGVSPADPGFDPSKVLELYVQGLKAEEILHLPYPAISRAAPLPIPARQSAAAPKLPARISIVIPNRNSPELIRMVLDGVLNKTEYPDFEVIVVDNGSTDAETLKLYDRYQADPRFQVDIEPGPFNFSAMVNRGISLANGDNVLLLNNDIEVLDKGWLAEMAACLERSGTGIVGAKLLYPDRRIQHAGVVLGHRSAAGHWYYKAAESDPGPYGTLTTRRSASIVTGAAMLISGSCLKDVGLWDEEHFKVAYNDVDYCARARIRGWGVTWTPHATLIHHESISRKKDAAALKNFKAERSALQRIHKTETYEDPAQSPWWSRRHSRPRLMTRKTLPAARSFMGG